MTIICYGGQGGGTKKKSSILEVGHMLSLEIMRGKKGQDLYHSKEWSSLWFHQNIRLNHKAFYLLCLYLEMIEKIAIEEDLHDENLQMDDQSEGLFVILSNGIFHLEERLKSSEFDSWSELLIFLGKLSIEQGVFPLRDECALCGEELEKFSEMYLLNEQGGFSCSQCFSGSYELERRGDGRVGRDLWELLGVISHHKYQELKKLKIDEAPVIHYFYQYFCFQLGFSLKQFKSLPMVL